MMAFAKIGVAIAALGLVACPSSLALAGDAAHPTVIELFQSQGCSSCPPAEANVGAVSDRADVLALSFEVDYWDRLGWKDTFSKAAWTARQYAYARAMGQDGVYTPQVVVNGRVAGDALEPGSLAGLMSRGDRGAGGPSIGFSGGVVTVGAGAAPAGGADVWLARYIPHTVEVAIPRGENGGHTLPYKDVVREMVLLGKWRGQAETFPVTGGSDPGPRRGGARAGERGRADPRGGEKIKAVWSFPRKRESRGVGESLDARFRGHDIRPRRSIAVACSARKVGRAVLDVLGADFIEREGGNGLTREVQLGKIDRTHPAVVHRPIIIDLMAHVGDDRPLRVAEMEVLGSRLRAPVPSECRNC